MHARLYLVDVSFLPSETPPLLFETKCNPEVGISFGGTPTVYLHSPRPGAVSEFHIRSLSSGLMVSGWRAVDIKLVSQKAMEEGIRREGGRIVL